MRNSGLSALNAEDLYQSDLGGAQEKLSKEPELLKDGGKLIPLNYETVSDEVLVELYREKRDETALSNIILRYRDTMLGFAMKMTGNRSDAEDIVQEISLTLVKKLGTFKGNSKFSTWLYRVTQNACYMVLNRTRKKCSHEVTADYIFESAPLGSGKWTETPSNTALYREVAEVVERAVGELSEHNREIIRLKDMEGYSNAEVGEIMGISVAAVKSRLLRSRLILRKKLGAYFRDSA